MKPLKIMTLLAMLIGSIPFYSFPFGSSDLPIMLSRLNCTGKESNLFLCDRDLSYLTECTNSMLAGVQCEGIILCIIMRNNNCDT